MRRPRYLEENPSRDFVIFHRLDRLPDYVWYSVLPEIGTKVPTSTGIIDEQGVDAKLPESRVGINTSPFSTLWPSDSDGIVVCWSNGVIQDDRVPSARVMFCVFHCIHPEFDDVVTGMPVVMEVEAWENGVCAVVVEAPVSMEPTAVLGAPND